MEMAATLILIISYAIFVNLENLLALRFKEDTVYAVEYTYSNFRAIRVGDTMTRVRELLGEPIRKAQLSSPPGMCWIYAESNPNGRIHNFRIRNIEFDKDGLVLNKETGLYID